MAKDRSMVKKIFQDGEGHRKPMEGDEVSIKVEILGEAGVVLLEEQSLALSAGCGDYCEAIDEVVLGMKQGEACEVCCTDASTCIDDKLGLRPDAGSTVTIKLEMVSFPEKDVYSLNESEKVEHCKKRKEVGAKLFKQGAW